MARSRLRSGERVMRSVITDIARRSQAERRGGGLAIVTLHTAVGDAVAAEDPDVLRVAEAIDEVAALDGRLAQVVEMRWFAGLDGRFIRLLRRWLRAGGLESGKFSVSEQGTPQGAVISPLLADVYLHYVEDL